MGRSAACQTETQQNRASHFVVHNALIKIGSTARRVTASSFVKAVTTLSSGQLVAMAIPLLASPALGRIYRPEEYSLIATYMALSTVLAGVGNWQYAQAVLIEKLDANALGVVRICHGNSFVTALVAAIIGVGIYYFSNDTSWDYRWFLLLPLTTWMAGTSAGWAALANRLKKYRLLASVRPIAVLVTVLTSISFGLCELSSTGLMFSFLLGQLVSFGALGWMYLGAVSDHEILPRNRLWVLFRRHRHFAFFSTPSAFVGNFGLQLPIYGLGMISAAEMIGLFGRARQLIEMPATLVGTAVAQVFQQRAAKDYAESKNCRPIFKRTLLMLAVTCVPLILILAVFAPVLFRFILGPNWEGAGVVARIIAPMLILRILCSPLSVVHSIVGKQREAFLLTLATTSLLSVTTAIAVTASSSTGIVVAFSACYAVTYTVFLARAFILSDGRRV